MAPSAEHTGLLSGLKAILEYTGFSEFIYQKWIKAGMPVWYFDGTPYAHKENLEAFFKSRTLVSSRELSDDIILCAGPEQSARAKQAGRGK